MAHYVPIPKDLNDIKEKFIMGFTKRQVICFGIGLVLGAPVYFLTRASIGMSGAIFAMGAVAAPAISISQGRSVLCNRPSQARRGVARRSSG